MDGHSQSPISGQYKGAGGELFGLAFVTGLLTFLTAGIYRFWAKTRIRKYIWSSISADGDSFEYTGTGLEKLLGFLMAIVFLAIYMGLIQMLLFFFGMTLFREPQSETEMILQFAGLFLTFFAIAPLILFAIYRARRYKMARTRWRGVRFGMEKGAWGYVLRAIGHWILTIITLGILLPRKTFYLEKYMTDRTWFGDAKFEQGGKWTALYGAMKHIFIGIVAASVGLGLATEMGGLFFLGVLVGYVWTAIGFLHYRVQSFAYLTSNKTLDGVTFASVPMTSSVLGRLLLGAVIIIALMSIIFGIIGALTFGALASMGDTFLDPTTGLVLSPPLIVPVVGYVLALIVANALSLVFFTQPVIAHIVEQTQITNPAPLAEIRQRISDAGADADGFADALDVGGAI